MVQEIAVLIIGILTGAYLLWKIYKMLTNKESKPNCGCSGCSGCSIADLKKNNNRCC